MAAKGLADETALRNAYGYLIEQASKGTEYAKATTRELKLLLNQAGEASEKNLKNMLEWAKAMPEHFDRLGGDSLKYLKERWANYTKNGTAEKIEQGLKEAAEKLPEGEELGLDGVKAVVEEVISTSNLSKVKLEHVLKNHTFGRMKVTIDNMMKKGLKEQAEKLLSDKSFFNPSWSEQQVADAVNQVYNQILLQGYTDGTYTISAFGENISIYLEKGVLHTAYGAYKLTLLDFGY